jgi:hypothetical protein
MVLGLGERLGEEVVEQREDEEDGFGCSLREVGARV